MGVGLGDKLRTKVLVIHHHGGGSGVRMGSERGERPMAPLPKKGTFPLS